MRRAARCLAFAVLALAGSSAGAAAPRRTIVYVHDRSDAPKVHAFRMEGSGRLTPVNGSPFSVPDPVLAPEDFCTGMCQTLAFSERRNLLFATWPAGVTSFLVGADGSLALAAGSPFGPEPEEDSGDFRGVGVVEIGDRTFVYAAETDGNRLRGYEAADDGTLAEVAGSPFLSDEDPTGLSTAGRNVFVCNATTESMTFYRADEDGVLDEVAYSPTAFDTRGSVNAQVDPAGTHLFVLSRDPAQVEDSEVHSFLADPKTGVIARAADSPFDLGFVDAGTGLSVGRTGPMFAIASGGTGVDDVHPLRRRGSGAIEPLGPARSTGVPGIAAHAVDRPGRMLVVASPTPGTVATYRVHRRTGSIANVDSESAPGASITAVILARR